MHIISPIHKITVLLLAFQLDRKGCLIGCSFVLQWLVYQSNSIFQRKLTPMIEQTKDRKRTHRIKTMTSHFHQKSVMIALENRMESTTFKTEIAKIETALHRQGRENRAWSSVRKTSLARKNQALIRNDIPMQKQLNFHLTGRSNNEELIAKLLEDRGRWTRSHSKLGGELHFIWGHVNNSQMNRLRGREMLSRIRGSCQMTDKGKLYENITKYCDRHDIDLSFLPITFFLDRDGPIHELKQNIKEFIEFFRYIRDNTTLMNTWIMKPTNLNQGREIHLFNTLKSFLKIVSNRSSEFMDLKSEGSADDYQLQIEKALEEYVRADRSLIVQKYIENPLLIKGHKFDIRMWVLVDHLGNYYMFEQGYLRFTSLPYKLNVSTINDNFMHLTNHSLQKYSPNYSEDHNLQPMEVLKQHFIANGTERDFQKVNKKMKDIVEITLHACLNDAIKKRNHLSFEVFGFDFLIDRQHNVRLIEANCNPAISQDCQLLTQLIPKMLNDAFKLTIDKVYHTLPTKMYHIPRLNSQNSWIHLGKLGED